MFLLELVYKFFVTTGSLVETQQETRYVRMVLQQVNVGECTIEMMEVKRKNTKYRSINRIDYSLPNKDHHGDNLGGFSTPRAQKELHVYAYPSLL